MPTQTESMVVGAWRSAAPRWGHPLHSLCSYMAMFPPAMPHVFIRWLTEPGDIVYDPFSGRGTTALEACLCGRVGLGSDLNPLAVLLTAAKASPPTSAALHRRLRSLAENQMVWDVSGQPEHLRSIFSDQTLGQLLWLREELGEGRIDRFLLAALAGILHLNANSQGEPRGLTVSMPNTFSMAPAYVTRYTREHNLLAPETDVVERLAQRIAKLDGQLELPVRGKGWQHDVCRLPGRRFGNGKAKLVFTSPPYLHVMKYGKYNWLRLWLIGEDAKSVDSRLISTQSLPRYCDFMRRAITGMSGCLRSDGYACLVIGDVEHKDGPIHLAHHVAEACVEGSGLRVVDVLEDRMPGERKVSRIWGKTRGQATKTDRILVLAGPEAPSELPSGTPKTDF